MKVAAAGKSGVGTITIAGLLNRMPADEGQTVVAVDGDAIVEINHSELDIVDACSFADTYGCSCEQILDCQRGQNNGEIKHGCFPSTMDVWTQQVDWALDCQENAEYGTLVVPDGDPKPAKAKEDTDPDGIADTENTDDDNDGVEDSEDLVPEDKVHDGKPDWHKRNWAVV